MSRIGDFMTRLGAKCNVAPKRVGHFGVVLAGNGEAVITGCQRILRYGEEEMILALSKGTLSVRGKGLFCFSFEGGAVTLRGAISALLLEGVS